MHVKRLEVLVKRARLPMNDDEDDDVNTIILKTFLNI